MIPEIGHFFLVLAFVFTALQICLPGLGVKYSIPLWMQLARPIGISVFILIIFSFICLGYAFVTNDFSVVYVAEHSNSQLPIGYKISAIWGGHEGSLLLWILLLSGWTCAVCLCCRTQPTAFIARVLAVLGAVTAGFLLFILKTSNPFARFLPDMPFDGRDLNPLLQDPGLIIHPPILYMGYVGLAIAFAFAIAALLQGEINNLWARWIRPWALVAWAFLTIGITLGSWWAYYELGWGGWWFWDPVENASFMPWLVGTALLHCLLLTDKRQVFLNWSVFLSIAGFSLSLLGTFLVRSGVLTSVHAFASDPDRGLFILQYLCVVIGSSLLLYAISARKLHQTVNFSFLSKETTLLSNNLLLISATGCVLIGTLYPLIYDSLFGDKLSVGYPYFNAVFIPLMIPLIILMIFAPLCHWHQDSLARCFYKTRWIIITSIVSTLLINSFIIKKFDFGVFIGIMLSLMIALSTVVHFFSKKTSLQLAGMSVAHLGFAMTIIGIVCVSHYEIEKDISLAVGETTQLGKYNIAFNQLELIEGPNYISYKGHFDVNLKDFQKKLYPEKRIYITSQNAMSETAIDPGFWRDIYIALGESITTNRWSVRIYYKPLVRWIWLGALLMATGGFLSAFGARRKYVKN